VIGENMSIDIVNSTSAKTDPTLKLPKPNNELGKDDFLLLLTTQLRYQDPTKPMSNEQFIAQTAQFSSLEQMQEMNSSMSSLLEFQKTSTKASALALIGKKVAADTSTFTLSDKSSASLDYKLPKDANVTIKIYDSSHNVVKSADLGKKLTGSYTFSWDGNNNYGIRANSGNYTYEIAAKDANGQDVSINKMVSGIVDGVSINGDQIQLTVGSSNFPLSAITQVLSNSGG
jgi:flagellar basal-body rod modification protein FlgD